MLKKIWGLVLVEEEDLGGKFREQKIQTSQMASQNESMQEVSSKLDKRKVFKFRGDAVWEWRGGISKTNADVTNDILKLIYVGSLIQIEQWERVQK